MRAMLFGLLVVVGGSCSNAVPRPASDQRQVVVFSTGQSETVEGLRQTIQPSQTASLDAQGTQMWSVDVEDVAALRTLENQGRLVRLHVEQDEAWPVLREIAKSPVNADAIRNVIGAAEPSSYVIGQLAREVSVVGALTSGFRLSVPLPGGTEIQLQRPQRLDAQSWQFDVEGGAAVMSTIDGQLRGTIQTPRGVFLIRPLPNGDHVVFEPQRPSVPDEPPHAPPKPAPKATPKTAPKPDALDIPPLAGATCADESLRILPLYSLQVETELAARKVSDVATRVSDAAGETRLSLNQLNLNIEVLPPVKITFRHTNDLLLDVANLVARGSRPTDEIAKARAATSADVVALFSTAVNACGAVLPKVLEANIARPDQAYFVLTPLIPECAFTFTHELGHVLGMRHHDDKTSAAEPLAYGFCEGSNRFSTVTATYRTCNGKRQLLWSDPMRTVNDDKGQALPAGDKVRHWEASVMPKQFKTAAAFHCSARG